MAKVTQDGERGDDVLSLSHVDNISLPKLRLVNNNGDSSTCTCPLGGSGTLQRATKLLSTSSPNIDRFLKFFHWHTLRTFCDKLSLKIPPHLKRVATLPSETQMLQTSVLCAPSHSLAEV